MAWRGLLLRALVLLAAAGCFSPTLDCGFVCGAGGLCPGDLTCGGDGYCHVDPSMSCTVAPGIDARQPGLPDATPAGEDAAQPVIDAAEQPAPDAAPPPPPDAPLAADAAPADAPLPAPDAPPPPPPDAAPPPPPDAAPPCSDSITSADDYADDEAVILDTRLGIDASGRLHATFVAQQLDGFFIRNARRSADAAAWTVEPIDAANDYLIGQFVDATGGVHVSYSGAGGALFYARRSSGGVWTGGAATQAFSFNSSILVDADQGVHIALKYFNDLVALYRPAGGLTWQMEIVDDLIPAAVQPDLHRLPSGALAVAYRADGPSMSSLRFASRSSGGVWSSRTLDDSGMTGNYPDMNVSPTGTVQIVYGDYTSARLKVLTWPSGGNPTIRPADEIPSTGRYNSAILDGQGRLHIATLDYGGGVLEYARVDPGATSVFHRPIEGVGAIEGRAALAFAPDGQLWVSFPSAVHGHLRVGRLCTNP